MRSQIYKCVWGTLAAGVILAVLAILIFPPASAPKPRTERSVPRSHLDLRDGVLYMHGKSQPFQGKFFENYPGGGRKLLIEVKNGRLNGRSLGYYPNGKMEVDEPFVDGLSHGTRTRWYENGNRRSVATIHHGKVTGPYTEWHDNGRKAVAMTARDGKPEGVVEAWHPSGAPKSRLRYVNGMQTEKQFWKDPADSTDPVAAAAKE